jgi:conjugative relaxase-like TrwC/TraI family protein
VAATIHKLSAGDGYQYYLKHIAAHDATRAASPLADYYSSHGESPGRWMGSGLGSLGVEAGSEVREEQMRALFGEGVHPEADVIGRTTFQAEIARGAKVKDAKRAARQAIQLGNPFAVYTAAGGYRERCAEAFVDYNRSQGVKWSTPVPDDVRARIRTEIATTMFREEYSRPPAGERELSGWVARHSRQATTAVAGWDITFSPAKSVSVLWALAPRPVAAKIEAAHRSAVADALRYLEEEVAYTRLGARGVRQVDVTGLIATGFTHRDSRAGDPDLHTHVVISNKVCVLESDQPEPELAGDSPRRQRWRTLDGRMLYRATVTVSEIYNTRLEMHLEEMLGLEFAVRPGTDPDKRPIREIVGVDLRLIEHWSARAAAITARLGQLATAFHAVHGREPTATEMFALAQQATLETRQAKKQLRSLAQQRTDWQAEALDLLGSPAAIAAMVYATLHPARRPRPHIDSDWINRAADQVVATVAGERATWQKTHIRSEAERIVRGQVPRSRWREVTEVIVAAALEPSRSIPRGEPDRIATPAPLRRRDGSSVYLTADSQLYTSSAIVTAEARLVAMARLDGGRIVSDSAIDMALLEYTANNPDRPLKPGQIALVKGAATSGLRFQLGIAAAGTGKTTAMQLLTQAWTSEGGTVVGLAPSAAAAAVLGEKTGAVVATIDKLTHTLDQHTPSLHRLPNDPTDPSALVPGWIRTIGPHTLVIIDEIAQAGTLKLEQAVSWLLARGATIRGIGDHQQLTSVAAGGVVRDIMAVQQTLTLNDVVRFRDDTEAAVTLALRAGDAAGIAFYTDNNRVHVGAPDTVIDAAYRTWATDIASGRDAIMLAPTHEIVRELNHRARTDRLAHSPEPAGPQIELSDGLCASVGDIIRTGENNPRLRISRTDYVRNGYRWIITAVRTDGSAEAVHLREGGKPGRRAVLPAHYLRSAVTLGYAGTIDSAQGITAEVCHGVLLGSESRQQLYVMATRGSLANHLWVVTGLDGTEQSLFTEAAMLPRTAVDILIDILGHDGAQKSATTLQREAQDPFLRLGPLVDTYTDALGTLAEHALGPDALDRIEHTAEQLLAGLTEAPAWPTLRQHLATLAVSGVDPATALQQAISARPLDDALDVAAVLDWRLDTTGTHSTGTGPLPWLPTTPPALRDDPDTDRFLTALTERITHLAHRIQRITHDWTTITAPPWATPLVELDNNLVTDLALWRAANRIPDTDPRPAGPHAVPNRQRHHQQELIRRVRALLGSSNRAASRWASLADSIDRHIVDDPYWPQLADQLDTMHRAGIDVPAHLVTAAAERPLPDEQPAAALRWRLHRQLATIDFAPSHRLRPPWVTVLDNIFGVSTAMRMRDAPAWPILVAAVDSADPIRWQPADLLTIAADLIADNQDDSLLVSDPRELATALARRVEAIHHHTPGPHTPPPQETPHPATDELDAAKAGVPDPENTDLPAELLWAPPNSYALNAAVHADDDYLASVLGTAERGSEESAADPDEEDPEWDSDEITHNWVMDRLRRYGKAGLEDWKPGSRYPDLTPEQRVTQLRADLAEQQHHVDELFQAIRADTGRHLTLGIPHLLQLRARADAQRPYRIAALETHQALLEADHQAEIDQARVHDAAADIQQDTSHLTHADELEALADAITDKTLRTAAADLIADLRAQPASTAKLLELHHAQLIAEYSVTISDEARTAATVAQQNYSAAAAPEGIVTELDIIEARLTFQDLDQFALDTARLELSRTERELRRAERELVIGRTEASESTERQPENMAARADSVPEAAALIAATHGGETLATSPAHTPNHQPPPGHERGTSLER